MYKYSTGVGDSIGKWDVLYGRKAAPSILNGSGGGSIRVGKDGDHLYSLWLIRSYGCDSRMPERDGKFPVYYAAHSDRGMSVQGVLGIRHISHGQNAHESVYFLSGFLDADDSDAGNLLLGD